MEIIDREIDKWMDRVIRLGGTVFNKAGRRGCAAMDLTEGSYRLQRKSGTS